MEDMYLPPVRCYRCGKVLGDKWDKYVSMLSDQAFLKEVDHINEMRRKQQGQYLRYIKTPQEVAFERLGLTRYCCRMYLARPTVLPLGDVVEQETPSYYLTSKDLSPQLSSEDNILEGLSNLSVREKPLPMSNVTMAAKVPQFNVPTDVPAPVRTGVTLKRPAPSGLPPPPELDITLPPRRILKLPPPPSPSKASQRVQKYIAQ